MSTTTNPSKTRVKRIAVCALAALWLAACGGGGGDPVAPSPAPGPASSPGPAPAPAPGPAPAPAPAPASVRLVNTTQVGDQTDPSLATLRDGGYVIAWTSRKDASAPDPNAVCWQRYAADGAAIGTEVCIVAPFIRLDNAVAALADGGFVLAWQVIDGSNKGIQAQRYDSTGSPVGPVQQVSIATGFFHTSVDAAGLAGGGYVVTWNEFAPSGDVFARRYDANGTAMGPEQRVNTYTGTVNNAARTSPRVAALSGGGYAVVWISQFQGGSPVLGTYLQRYNADGSPAGSETLLSDFQVQGAFPQIVGLAGGGFVVSWHQAMVVAQQFAADGSRVGAQMTLDPSFVDLPHIQCRPFATCPPFQRGMGMTALEDGGYVIAWTNVMGMVTPEGTYGRRFAASGATAGPITRLTPPNTQVGGPMVAAGDRLVIASTEQDAELQGIYVRDVDAQALVTGTGP